MTYKTISVGTNAKTVKGDGSEFITAITYHKPYKTEIDGKTYNFCAMAETAGCHKPCLFTAGRGQMNSVQQSRYNKTVQFFTNRVQYMDDLNNDLTTFSRRARANRIQPCYRPNGTSDYPWHNTGIMSLFNEIQFYDYTKIVKRAYETLPENYHLTLSYSQHNEAYADSVVKAVLDTGINMAVVFRNKDKPKKFLGLDVIDGDQDDLRFLDPQGVVVGLYAKGKAKQDTSGFVIDA